CVHKLFRVGGATRENQDSTHYRQKAIRGPPESPDERVIGRLQPGPFRVDCVDLELHKLIQRNPVFSVCAASGSLRLSGHEHNYDDVRCAEFGLWQGARREHIPKWICDRRATQPQAKFGATLRAAFLFRPDFVAPSSQTPEGYARRSRLAWPKNPSPRTSS